MEAMVTWLSELAVRINGGRNLLLRGCGWRCWEELEADEEDVLDELDRRDFSEAAWIVYDERISSTSSSSSSPSEPESKLPLHHISASSSSSYPSSSSSSYLQVCDHQNPIPLTTRKTYPSSASHTSSSPYCGVHFPPLAALVPPGSGRRPLPFQLLGFSIAMHCSTKVLKLICLFLPFPLPLPIGAKSCSLADDRSILVPDSEGAAIGGAVTVEGFEPDALDSASLAGGGAESAIIRGGESFLNGRFSAHRVMCVSLFVCNNAGRTGRSFSFASPAPSSASSIRSRGAPDPAVGPPAPYASSSSSDSAGLNRGLGRSLVSSSLMLRYLRMGFFPDAVERSNRSCAELALSTELGWGPGLGGGDQSTAVWRGPYSQVTSESFSLRGERRRVSQSCNSSTAVKGWI
jgi:hypothetical protein